MKIDISVNISRGERADSGPAGWKAEGMRLIHEANEAANNPEIDAAQRDLRLRWLGGAIKLYAVAAGESAEAIRASLPQRGMVATTPPPVPGAARPDPSSLPMGALGVVTPPAARTNRPPRHPGAQRPVQDQPDLPADMFEGLPDFEGVAEAVARSEMEAPAEDSPTQVTAHAPEIRSADSEAG